MSNVRKNPPAPVGELASEFEGDQESFEVFLQLARRKPLKHVGTVEAPDAEWALRFACEHYGRDQPCYRVWVAPRSGIFMACSDQASPNHRIIWRLSDQSYREPKGYNVGQKWRRFRTEKDYKKYKSQGS